MANLLDQPTVTDSEIADDTRLYIVVDPTGTPVDRGLGIESLNKFLDRIKQADVASTSYSLVIGDKGAKKRFTSSSPITVTVPTNASVGFEVGTQVQIFQAGTGQVTIAGAVGVTINSLDGKNKVAGQYGSAVLQKVATNEWDLIGALVA